MRIRSRRIGVKWALAVKRSMTANASRAETCHDANRGIPARPSVRKIKNEMSKIARTNISLRLTQRFSVIWAAISVVYLMQWRKTWVPRVKTRQAARDSQRRLSGNEFSHQEVSRAGRRLGKEGPARTGYEAGGAKNRGGSPKRSSCRTFRR